MTVEKEGEWLILRSSGGFRARVNESQLRAAIASAKLGETVLYAERLVVKIHLNADETEPMVAFHLGTGVPYTASASACLQAIDQLP